MDLPPLFFAHDKAYWNIPIFLAKKFIPSTFAFKGQLVCP